VGNRSSDEDQISRLAKELKNGTWLANAQQRSQRRKSPWNMLLLLFGVPLWGAITMLLTYLASCLHEALYPAGSILFARGPMSTQALFVFVPSLIASVIPAMFLTNVLVYLIPPARRAMDAEDRDFPGTGYAASQRALFKVGLCILAIGLPIIFVAACLA